MDKLNTEFEKWFWELDGYHVRAELFWDDINNKRGQEILRYLKSAYEHGYKQGIKNCKENNG